nr:hypothetical protein Iba_chr01aCG13810 [Ipomoea batatas]
MGTVEDTSGSPSTATASVDGDGLWFAVTVLSRRRRPLVCGLGSQSTATAFGLRSRFSVDGDGL